MELIEVASDGNQITAQIDAMSIGDIRANFEEIMSLVVNVYGDNEEESPDAA